MPGSIVRNAFIKSFSEFLELSIEKMQLLQYRKYQTFNMDLKLFLNALTIF